MPSSKLSNKPRHNTRTDSNVFRFEAIGTQWQIYTPTTSLPEALRRKLLARIDTFDAHYSRFRPDSLVSSIAASAGTYEFPADAAPLLDVYQKLFDLTGGEMTPLVGQLLADAGYDANYRLTPQALGDVPNWTSVMHFTVPHLTTTQPLLLDFGAAGKGYLVDIISGLLQHAGVTRFSVNAGGDIYNYRVSGETARIGLEHPEQTDEMIGVATLGTGSICGSAGNRRAWGAYNHIMSPRTKQSPNHLRAVWVCANNALTADALTTALYFVPPETLQAAFTFSYAVLTADMSIHYSADFPAHFFTNEGDNL